MSNDKNQAEAEVSTPEDQLREQVVIAEQLINRIMDEMEVRLHRKLLAAFGATCLIVVISLCAWLLAFSELTFSVKQFVPPFLILTLFGFYVSLTTFYETSEQNRRLERLLERLKRALRDAEEALYRADSESRQAGYGV